LNSVSRSKIISVTYYSYENMASSFDHFLNKWLDLRSLLFSGLKIVMQPCRSHLHLIKLSFIAIRESLSSEL